LLTLFYLKVVNVFQALTNEKLKVKNEKLKVKNEKLYFF